MPTTLKMTRKSSRLGSRNYKSPPPLRFKSIKDAKAHIKANGLKYKGHVRHTRGIRINVVDAKGKPRTLSIERKQDD